MSDLGASILSPLFLIPPSPDVTDMVLSVRLDLPDAAYEKQKGYCTLVEALLFKMKSDMPGL